ncbi:glucosylceramidase [Terrimonas sp. NA20]|uniref:Glucosylceramidase n=1 Tax=Terrimonas ginsenosidimutans TaxID=2908004 RepID=A0ABS9KUY4_9BACT|nr:glycoside hydrolase family 30 beta sandwich domain-containing protein [Terrimonas ginsenosidimutans]MCG2616130.1 glucosylceramidase [Terrimonas ginsenosidimutans]
MQSKRWLVMLAWMAIAQTSCGKKSGGDGGGTTPPPPDPPPVTGTNDVAFWLTKGDQTALLQKQSTVLTFTSTANGSSTITVDSTQKFQTIDGFGYTLTGGSASLISGLPAAAKSTLLQELFGNGDEAAPIGVSYLRISIGASDLSSTTYSYNDISPGQTDLPLANFSLDGDRAFGTGLIPLLKEILAINPKIKILATPWSAPVWMKDNGNFKGGSLKPEYYSVYANYFVKYIQQMKAEGITIDAVTPQNEPMHDGNNPSMKMTSVQQGDFIKNHLGPAFRTAGLTTKIIIWDHNCDMPQYPLDILNDPAARPFVDGSAFHLYAGNITALSGVHAAYPDKNIYFTEQYTASNGDFGGDLKWHIKNVIIGSMRNWSRNALEWNLANDPAYGPHTVGGCTTCKGGLTINGSSYSRNVAYYIIAHAAKFVPAGSVRIASDELSAANLYTVAFVTPANKKVLIVLNEGNANTTFNLKFKDKAVLTTMPANSVGTYIW